jgi:arylsulfatase A-like enzyme
LYVNFLEPHTPFASALNDLHSAEQAPLRNHPGLPPADREPLHYQRRRAQQLKRDREAGVALSEPGGFQRLARNYAGLCSLVDQAIHRILWALEASGQAENTVVVYTSDHGEMMGAHQLLYKQVMYQESTCVPFLLRAPFAKIRPQRVAAPVSHIETASMVLDLLGKKDHGENHLAQLRGAKRGEDHVFLEWTSEGQDQGPNARTVVSPDGWKLVLHDTDRSMLFNLRADPQELNNLYGRPEGAAVQKRLRARIADWQQRAGDKLVLPEN